ncbi:MAG: hypothetical protein G8D58_10230 [gamma proteobacterium symbiont of Phacoides pectinatus]
MLHEVRIIEQLCRYAGLARARCRQGVDIEPLVQGVIMTEGATRTTLQSFKSGDPNPLQPRFTSKTIASDTEKIKSVEGIEQDEIALNRKPTQKHKDTI